MNGGHRPRKDYLLAYMGEKANNDNHAEQIQAVYELWQKPTACRNQCGARELKTFLLGFSYEEVWQE